MLDIFVYTEKEIEDDDLMRFTNRHSRSAADGSYYGSYSLEDQKRGVAVYLGLVDDPEVPPRLERLSARIGKKFFPGVAIACSSGSFEFAISVAAQIVRRWGGVADIDSVGEYTLALAKREGLPLLFELDQGDQGG